MPDAICVLWGGTKGSVTVTWLTYCLHFFCYYMFTFFQWLISEPAFCNSGEAWETKAFLQTRDRQRT